MTLKKENYQQLNALCVLKVVCNKLTYNEPKKNYLPSIDWKTNWKVDGANDTPRIH